MPLFDLFWAMLWFFLWIAWLWLLIRVVADIFRSDASGVAKALWALLVVVLPLIGVLAYLIVHGESMTGRELRDVKAVQSEQERYIREVAGTGGVADELERLANLRERGVLTDAEFDAQKSRILASSG